MTKTQTQETPRTRVEAVCDKYIAKYEKAVEKFNADAAISPLSAIEWKTAEIAKTSVAYREAFNIKQGLAKSDDENKTLNNIQKWIARERKDFDRIRVARSTSAIANEIENYQTEARVEMLFSSYGFFRELEDAINDR